jgi:hypothetical protein
MGAAQRALSNGSHDSSREHLHPDHPQSGGAPRSRRRGIPRPRTTRAPLVARRLGGPVLGTAPVGGLAMGDRRRGPGTRHHRRRPHRPRTSHRPGRLGAAAGPGVPHGAGAVVRAGVGTGRPGPHAPPGGLHLVQPPVGAHRPHHPRLRRLFAEGTVGDHRRPRPQLPRDVAGSGRDRRPVHDRGDLAAAVAGAAALRVLAPSTSTATSAQVSPCHTSCGQGRSSSPRVPPP